MGIFSLLSHRPVRGGGEKAMGACEVELIEKIQILKECRNLQMFRILTDPRPSAAPARSRGQSVEIVEMQRPQQPVESVDLPCYDRNIRTSWSGCLDLPGRLWSCQ